MRRNGVIFIVGSLACLSSTSFGFSLPSRVSPGNAQQLAHRQHRQRARTCYGTPVARELDTDALKTYPLAIGVQMAGITSFLALLDLAVSVSGIDPASIPLPAILVLFVTMSLRSRVFNPLNNKRPDLEKVSKGEETSGFNDRTMPSWTPPGVTFPIMWVLIVAPLRAFSTSLVMASHGYHFCDPTILALMLHLSIGDTWNTVNNAEKRLGAAVPGIACVWLSGLNAARAYSDADDVAGLCLYATAVWIAVAGALIADTWRINNSEGDEPLYPYVGQAKTKFAWKVPFLK